MATSPARIAASRANSLRSSGPKTVKGKLASSMNAVKHGVLSRRPLLNDEDPAEYQALAARLLEQLAPEPGVEELLVDDLLGVLWRLRRLQKVETALYALGSPRPVQEALRQAGEVDAAMGAAFAAQAGAFGVLTRYETSLINRMRRDLSDLERLQSARESDGPALFFVSGGS